MDKPKLLVAHVPSGNTIFTADALQIGAELWIVPHWLESQDGKWRTPKRAIRVDVLEHQAPGAHGADLMVTYPIPRAVLDGPDESAEGIEYQVVVGPSDHFGQIARRQGH